MYKCFFFCDPKTVPDIPPASELNTKLVQFFYIRAIAWAHFNLSQNITPALICSCFQLYCREWSLIEFQSFIWNSRSFLNPLSAPLHTRERGIREVFQLVPLTLHFGL